jgi:alpha-D-xyloside xylohydrolase
MKFSDGLWLNQKGYEVKYASQAYKTTTDSNSITVLATPQTIYNRAMTLGGENLEITYTSKAENVIKVSIKHFKGVADNAPKYELNEDLGYTPTINDSDDKVELISGDTKVVVSKGQSWNVEFSYKGKRLTGGAFRATSYIQESQFKANARLALQADDPFWAYPADPHTTYVREQLTLSVGEYVYGFGEKFTPFVKNGQVVETWNSDGGTCSDQSYKCIPFYISSRGYGIFVNSSDKVSFEVASDTINKVSFTIPGESLEYFVIGGENLQEVLSNYTTLTGKPALPPASSFGLWLSTSFTTNYDEQTVNEFVDGMAKRDIPLQMFHFDCFWMKEFEWCGFDWDEECFPDPKGMLSRLKDKGLGICVWINSYVGQYSKLFDEGVKNGYFILKEDGSVFQTDMWQPGMAIVDFTNPKACEWFASKVKALCDMGVTAIKTDFGERIPTKGIKYFDGSDPIKMHNYYTYIYNKTVFNALKEYYGENNACLFARSATVGGQKFPVHWGGDCSAEYSSMAETLRGGLSLCASGFGYFSHDIGGFEQTASPDVYKRWCAFGLMSSHSRLHGSTSYRVPWAYEEDTPDNPENACAVLRYFTKLKGRLMPYLFSQAVKTSTVGVPMMRAMVIDYANDPVCLHLDTQYMLGDNLLCAPVLNEDGIAEFYVPNGTWTDICTGETYVGNKYFTKKCSFLEMPILAKQNSIIGFGNFSKNVVYDYVQDTEFKIFNLEDGKSANVKVYDDKANLTIEITATRSGNTINVEFTQTDKSFKLTAIADGKTVSVDVAPNSSSAVINL